MSWASMLYNLEHILTPNDISDSAAKSWKVAIGSNALVAKETWPSTDESAESSDSDSASDEELARVRAVTNVTPRKRSDVSEMTESDEDINGAPVGNVQLPQRPSPAVTRDSAPKRAHRPFHTAKKLHSRRNQPAGLPHNLTPITNHGLFLATPKGTADAQSLSRSEDRIRAAQRLFRAIGNPTRADTHTAQLRTEETVQPEATPSRLTFFQSLSAQARKRNSEDLVYDPLSTIHESCHESKGMLKFSTSTQGTSHCIIDASGSTFELMITPPTPHMCDEEESKWGITGVRITSHRMPDVPSAPPSPQLQPPPFELAPGRAQHLVQEKRRITAHILSQQTLRHQGLNNTPPKTNCVSAPWNSATQTPLAATKLYGAPPRQAARQNSGNACTTKYVPPGRRRRMSEITEPAAVCRRAPIVSLRN